MIEHSVCNYKIFGLNIFRLKGEIHWENQNSK